MSAAICLPPVIIAKPAMGQPCNGCGLCCAMEPCGLAREFIGEHVQAPCPALERQDGRFVCGMIRRPSRYMPDLPNDWADEIIGSMFAEALGAGKGCDADDLEASPTPASSTPSFSEVG